MTLALLRLADAVRNSPLAGGFEHHFTLLQRQAISLGIQIRQLFHQMLATTQCQIATEIGTDRVARMVQHVQQRQRRAQAL